MASSGVTSDVPETISDLFAMIRGKQWAEILSLLVTIPASASRKDEYGYTPLHAALESDPPLDVLFGLLAAWPEASRIKNNEGFLPLHIAVQFQTPLAFVTELLAAYPQGVRERERGGRIPIEYALKKNATDEVLLALLLADMPYDLNKDDGSPTQQEHAGSWTHIMDHPDASLEQVKFLVKSVLDKFPTLAQLLAHTKDAKGREAIFICRSEIRAVMQTYLLFLGRFDVQQGPPVHKSATSIVK